MFLSTGTQIYDVSEFGKFEVGLKQGIWTVKAHYKHSDQYETLYANTNPDHCYEYLHKLGHLIDAKEVDIRAACECDEPPEADDSVDHTIPDDQRINAWQAEHDRLQAEGCGDANETAWERVNNF